MTENPMPPYSNLNNFSPPIGKKVINAKAIKLEKIIDEHRRA